MKKDNKIYCSYCNGETEAGLLEIHGTALGFIFLGLSHQNLYYKPFDEKYQEYIIKEEKVIKESNSLKARKCKDCGSISFIPNG